MQYNGHEIGLMPPCEILADMVPLYNDITISLMSPAKFGSSILKGTVESEDLRKQYGLLHEL